ncbi:MAG: hypothetical protein GF368_00115 [Candidatus Aenigmarchaeota archaeon]|nr:hypothetical protein [Candidatus Aenigmarchaeota archaeon]
MIKTRALILAILTLLILLPITVNSMSMGSLIKKNTATVEAGDEIRFDILFWNLADSYSLEISEKYIPSDWKVSIEPNNFILDNSIKQGPPYDDGEYINLPGIGTIKPKEVEVEIKIPKFSESGDYTVSLVAITSGSDGEISVAQERDLNFKVKVLGKNEEVKENEELEEENFEFTKEEISEDTENNVYELSENGKTRESEDEPKEKQLEEDKSPLTGKIVEGISNSLSTQGLIILLGVMITVFGSVVIYKYA